MEIEITIRLKEDGLMLVWTIVETDSARQVLMESRSAGEGGEARSLINAHLQLALEMLSENRRRGERDSSALFPPIFGNDFPNLRWLVHCALCHDLKDRGAVVCWRCYGRHHFRIGVTPEITAELEAAEKAAPDA